MVPVQMEATSIAPLALLDRNGTPAAIEDEAGTPVRTRITGPPELPPARKPDAATLGALAVAAGISAVVLGALALVLGFGGGGSSAEPVAAEASQAIGLLSKPSTVRTPLAGSAGTAVLAVGSGGRAVLVLKGLGPAPPGWAYRAWVVGRPGGKPLPAASFSGEERVVPLSRPVPPAASVAVSLEDASGANRPRQPLRFTAERPS
jgi:hypothetical protein